MERRTLVKGAAWSVPVIAVAATAPAFAASPINCIPVGFKKPGNGHNCKDYFLKVNCASTQPITGVTIDGIPAVDEGYGFWVLRNNQNSRAKRTVVITTADGGTWTGEVKFPPYKRN